MLKFKILFLTLFCSSLAFSQVKFQKHDLAKYLYDINPIHDVDLDNDADIDLIGISQTNELIFWLENDGKQNFIKHFISSDVPWGSYIYPIDLEQDGDVDILYSVNNNDGRIGYIGWFENDGKQNFTFHEFMKCNTATSIMGIDYDFDGDNDVLASSSTSYGLIWLENDGNLSFSLHTICTTHYIKSFIPFDFDKDSDYDFFVRFDQKLEYWENKDNLTYNRNYFDKHVSGFTFWDFDNDGDFDILGSKSAYLQRDDPEAIPFIFFWQNDGMQNFTKLDLFQNLGYFEKIADFDLDGDLDILTSNYYLEYDSVTVYNKFELQSLGVEYGQMKVVDLDNDGDPDIIFMPYSSSHAFWYENLGKPRPISFPDSNLAKAVRRALGDTLETICDTHLKHLVQLNAENQQIQDLTGLEFAKNLKSLNLKSNTISNLQPLQGLLHLDTLILADNQLNDSSLVNLYNLDSLVYLDLQHNPQIKSGTAMEKLGQELLLINCENILWDGTCGVDPNTAPFIQNFVIEPESVFVNQVVTLEITAGDSELHSVQFLIDWGEGRSLDSTISVSVDSNQVFKHLYQSPGTFAIKCQLRDEKGALSSWTILKTIVVKEQVSSINQASSIMYHFQLYSNFPNPFNQHTLIKFELDEPGEHSLAIYNMRGELVRYLSQGFKAAGMHSCYWDGTDMNGVVVSSGIYWCHLKHQERQAKIKVMLIK